MCLPPGYSPNTWLLTPYTVSTELGKTKQNKVFPYKQLWPFQYLPPRSLCFKKERGALDGDTLVIFFHFCFLFSDQLSPNQAVLKLTYFGSVSELQLFFLYVQVF